MSVGRDRDEPGKLAAFVLAVVVHVAFFALLVFGVSWQHRPSAAIEVELWNNLPPVKTPPLPEKEAKPETKLKPPPPEEELKPPPPPPPPEPKVEVKPKPVPDPKPVAKPDIALEKEKQEKERLEALKREQAAKVAAALKREQAEARKRDELAKAEALKREQAEERKRQELEKQKIAALESERKAKEADRARMVKALEDEAQRLQQQQASAQAKLVDEYRRRISDKIRRYVIKDPCAALGNPQIVFEAILLPDGNTLQPPRIKRSSGSAACDDAVLRAVIRAQPLPLPPDPQLFAQFRELNLDFRPNE
jgi:colicin import membrane protein